MITALFKFVAIEKLGQNDVSIKHSPVEFIYCLSLVNMGALIANQTELTYPECRNLICKLDKHLATVLLDV